MRRIGLFSLVVLLGVSTGTSLAQKVKDPFAPRSVHAGGKAKSPYLSHHRSYISAPAPANSKGPGAELSKIEQMSARGGSSSAMKTTRVKPAGLPRVNAAKGDRSTAINFNGKSGAHSTVMTRSGGGKSGARAPQGPKIH